MVIRQLATLACAALALQMTGCDMNGRAETPAAKPPTTAAPSNAAQQKPPALAPAPPKDDAVAEDNRALDKTFDDILFDIEPDAPFERSMLTPEIEALDGRRIRIRGYILPTAQSRGIKQFVLVRDNMECCFGPGAALCDCILVEMLPDKSAEFTIRPVTVTGEFRIEIFTGFDGRPLAIYQMRGESVE